jgi:hypothetical protein
MNWLRSMVLGIAVLSLLGSGAALKAKDNDDKTPGSITVAFGAGLNTAQPGNTPNHHIIPQEFKVRITKARKLNGDVVVVPATVNFIVSGFHWPWVYNDGVKLGDIVVPAAGTFVNYNVNVFAKGINPGTPPTFADITSQGVAGVFPLDPAFNRTDSFGFSAPGKYLVICNVRGHFIDGMYAWINVVDDEDDN